MSRDGTGQANPNEPKRTRLNRTKVNVWTAMSTYQVGHLIKIFLFSPSLSLCLSQFQSTSFQFNCGVGRVQVWTMMQCVVSTRFPCCTVLLALLLLLLFGTVAAAIGNPNGHHSHHSHIYNNNNTRLHSHHHRVHRSHRRHVKGEVELLPGVTMAPSMTRNTAESTRLRRLHHAHNPYNKVMTRRQGAAAGAASGSRPNEWDYNTYNIYTNTFGPPPPPPVSPHAGKGEDNTQDVEFIGVSGRTGRGFEYIPPMTTSSPPTNLNRRSNTPVLSMGTVPPLVPARRGYSFTTTAPSTTSSPAVTTDDPYETNTISRNYPTDAKEMER